MDKSDNVVSFENVARERDSSLSARLVQDMRKVVLDTVPRLVQSLYDKLDDGLFEQALFEKAGKSDSLDNLFFDTMRQLRKQREGFIKSYVRKLTRNYDDFWQLKTPREDQSSMLMDISEEDLMLIEHGDLEEDLALDGVIAKGMRQFSKEVYALNQRFAAMKGIEEISDEENPLAPHTLSHIFPASISGLEVDLRIRLVIYKLFEKEVMQYLGAMYDDLNEMLKQAGILPKLPSRVKRNPVSPAVIRQQEISGNAEVSETDSIAAAQQAAVDDTEQAAMFNTLRGLLHNTRIERPASHAQLPQVSADDLISALSSLQLNNPVAAEVSLDQAANNIGGLRENLAQNLGMGNDAAALKAFSGMDEDTIDVISMLFEFILEDTNLPDAMKALLSRLQIPMLKVAILDRQFFSDKQHPARRLLNLLAKSAVGWVDDGDRSENSLYGHISAVVNRILEGFHEDLGLFETLYEDFSNYVSKEEQGAVVIEERITEVTRGKEKMKLAQIRVAEVINSRVKGVASLPDVVKELLKDGWKDVLTLVYLRQGEESEKWIHVVGLVDKLLWSVQPKIEMSDRQKLLKSIPELLKALRAELVEISYDQHKLGRIFKELQACHIHALKGGKQAEAKAQANIKGATPPTTAEPAAAQANTDETAATSTATSASTMASSADDSSPAKDGDASGEQAATQQQPVEPTAPATPVVEDIIEAPTVPGPVSGNAQQDEFLEQAQALEIGTWVDWVTADGKQLRGKLTWKSALTGTLIFVGRKGTKLAELNVADLAELFRLDQAHCLQGADQPLLERAMNAMVETLKKTEPAAPAG